MHYQVRCIHSIKCKESVWSLSVSQSVLPSHPSYSNWLTREVSPNVANTCIGLHSECWYTCCLAVCDMQLCDCVILYLQQLELASEPSQPGSSLSLRVQPVPSTGTPATTTSHPANENSDAVNNNVMSHSVTNPQTLTSQHVQRSASSTHQHNKTGQLTLIRVSHKFK